MYTLFEVLSENNLTDDFLSTDEMLHKSILRHLKLLLNSRQGSLKHLPEFGLPDIAEIYQSLPYSLNDFARVVSQTILRYEPRLAQVYVRAKQIEQNDCVIRLVIDAKINNRVAIKLNTYFSAERLVNIEKMLI